MLLAVSSRRGAATSGRLAASVAKNCVSQAIPASAFPNCTCPSPTMALRQRGVPLLRAPFVRAASSWLDNVVMAPKDPILGVTERFLADPNPDKVSLGVGAYRDDAGKPVVLDVVREAELRVAGHHNHEYLPIGGHRAFCEESMKLAYGDNAEAVGDGRLATVQTLSGTGACRLFAEFQRRWLPGTQVYIPGPTWSNHHNIWRDAGVGIVEYPYYDPVTKGLAFDAMCATLSAASPGAVVLLHACAHNPTGVDPTREQWAALSRIVAARRLFPLFDSAYQGFASGDCQRDAEAVRAFLADGHVMGLAQSYAKNMGLYGQRVGTLSVVCGDPEQAARVESQLKAIARAIYSNPPLHGALLVHTILSTPELKGRWFREVEGMAWRIADMRSALRGALEAAGSPHDWRHITDQIGMFAYTGMAPEQVDRLTDEHSIYLTRNGRISIAGLNTGNVQRVAEAIHAVTKDSPL